ncbi:MAG TPA: ADP-ribosylglycohydrolase family protein [Kofleriaceae bacterium]|jgi:ADP-ribosylglycohydrolase|nr:ADP-ribosylglycohydrolase family protein [Kofleriaceae bacterium]
MDRFAGLLLGTAVGDSLGLPREGLSPRRARRLYPGPLRQRLGMLSDDTEHACMTAQALLAEPNDPSRFAGELASKLRWWLAALPPAIGFGTLRALLRSWLGFAPDRSGVYSAGNGAVMRAPIIGAWLDDADRIESFVAASTAITHRDPRAHAGALAIAIAAHHAVRDRELRAGIVLDHVRARVPDRELLGALERVERALDRPSAELARELGLHRGVTGYVHHTVPVCLHAWLRAPREFAGPVAAVIELGGDADTTGAIVGALAGASAGEGAIPREWLAIHDAPRSLAWIRKLARAMADRAAPIALPWPIVPLRNAGFALIVLAIGLRRLLPPY